MLPFVKRRSLTQSDSWSTKHAFEGFAWTPACHLHLGEKGLLFSKYKAQSPLSGSTRDPESSQWEITWKPTCARDLTSGATVSCTAPISGTMRVARTTHPSPHWPQPLLLLAPPRVCSRRTYHKTHSATPQTWHVLGEKFQ